MAKKLVSTGGEARHRSRLGRILDTMSELEDAESLVPNVVNRIIRFTTRNTVIPAPFAAVVYNWLRTHYKQLPTPQRRIASVTMEVDARSDWRAVPFSMRVRPAYGFVFYGGGEIYVVNSDGGDALSIRSIPGFGDVNRLVILAAMELDARTKDMRKDVAQENRFQIIDVCAEPRTANTATRRRGSKRDVPDDGDSQCIEEGGSNKVLQTPHAKDTPLYYKDRIYAAGSDSDSTQLFFDPHVEKLVSGIKEWWGRRTWHTDRGLPWKRGVLLHGPGGSGKSTCARHVAETLGIPLYRFNLRDMSDSEFLSEWGDMNTPCVALFEDFDNCFNLREPQPNIEIGFETILNTLSGVNSSNGVITFFTTNDIEKIDPALGAPVGGLKTGVVPDEFVAKSTRPGRIDVVVYMGALSEAGRESVAKNILGDWPEAVRWSVSYGAGMTIDQFRDHCCTVALEILHKQGDT